MASAEEAPVTRRMVTLVVVAAIRRRRKDPFPGNKRNCASSVAIEPRATTITPSPVKDAKVLFKIKLIYFNYIIINGFLKRIHSFIHSRFFPAEYN